MSKEDRDFGIEPLNVPTGRTAAAEQLRRLIESKRIVVGERLPSERELADLMDVGRTTVREAKSTLEALGLIETRPGSGSYVTRSFSQNSMSSLWSDWYANHHVDLIHLLQVREALELKAASLVVLNMPDGLAEELDGALTEMRRALEARDVEEMARLDAHFHSILARASGNQFLVKLLSSLDAVIADDRLAVYSIRARRERSMRDHENIVRAIRTGEGAVLIEALQDHFESVVQDVQDVSRRTDSDGHEEQ